MITKSKLSNYGTHTTVEEGTFAVLLALDIFESTHFEGSQHIQHITHNSCLSL